MALNSIRSRFATNGGSNLISRNSEGSISILNFLPLFIRLQTTTSRRHFSSTGETRLEDDARIDHQLFQKWHNGGGTFHRTSCIDPTVLIEIGAIVHSNTVVGANVHVGSGSIIGPAVTIGQSTKIGYNVAISNCTIGDSCVIHNGVCIGQDGFGFFVDEHGDIVKKPQILKAKIGNHVEIGANTCVDRGSWRDTAIGDHSKIDNLVQIGHNVVIGKSCMLCGQVGIAGSVTMGDYVTLGGRVGVRDHVTIASKWDPVKIDETTLISSNQNPVDPLRHVFGKRRKIWEVRLAANSCVTKDIKKPGDYGGFPAVPIQEWRRQVATLRTMK